MPANYRFFLLCFTIACTSACNHDQQVKKPSDADLQNNQKQIKEQFMRANQQLMQKENDEMDYYARSHKMPFIRTGSGVRYFVYKASEKGDSIKAGSEITMDYKVSLLDGTVCYTSEKDGAKTFVVAQETIESGIHIGVQYLKRGDKALILIPSPLAHGLLGDFNKIPPQTPILYDVVIY